MRNDCFKKFMVLFNFFENYSHGHSHYTEIQNLSAPKIDYIEKFQKHVQRHLLSFNINFVLAISIIKILGIPNTRKYFLLFYYINILLVFRNWVIVRVRARETDRVRDG